MNQRVVERCEFTRLQKRVEILEKSGGGGGTTNPSISVQLVIDSGTAGQTAISVPQMNGKPYSKLIIYLTGYGPLTKLVDYDNNVVGGGFNLLNGRETLEGEVYTISIF